MNYVKIPVQFAPLMVRDIGRRKYRPAKPEEIMSHAAQLHEQKLVGSCLNSPRSTLDYLTAKLRPLEYECFVMITLDARMRVIACHEMFRGSVSQAVIHQREVIKQALVDNASNVVLAHNHPSGDPEPSPADELMTTRIREALTLVEVRLLDHIVIGADRYASFAEMGRL